MHQSSQQPIVGLVPARGGSKGIPRKNLIRIDGLNLVDRAADACLKSQYISHVAVSSDNQEILSSVSPEVISIKRPESIASDESPIEHTFEHTLAVLDEQGLMPEIFVWLQPNIPIRRKGIVDEVVKHLLSNPLVTGAVTCAEIDSRIYWSKKINAEGLLAPIFDKMESFRRQELDQPLLIDGAVCAFRVKNLRQAKSKLHSYLGDRIVPVIQEEKIFSLELDEFDDLRVLYRWLTEAEVSDSELLNFFGLG